MTACQSVEIEVRESGDSAPEWNDFIDASEGACVYHDFRWKDVIERTFGHKCHYLVARAGNRVTGVLPLVEMKSLAFGHFFVSLPFVTYGGMVAGSASAERCLAAAAAKLVMESGARHVEFRQRGWSAIPWEYRQHKAAMTVRLPGRIEDYWSKLSSRLRGKIRKAQRAGATFDVLGREGSEDFYSIFTRNMRDLGTPVYPRGFFHNTLDAFGSCGRVFMARVGNNPVAAAFGLRHGQEIQLPWICSNYQHAHNYVNEFLYWSILEWASANSIRTVDLGRSTIGGGNYRFKTQWMPEVQPLHWYYWAADGTTAPNVNPDNPQYALAIQCWQHMPLALANLLGPRIVRNIP